MTCYLLDTNIVSEALKPRPSTVIAEWLQSQGDADLYIATFTIAEIWRGVLTTPTGRRRQELELWFAGPLGPQALFRDRVLSFDERGAIEWAPTRSNIESAFDGVCNLRAVGIGSRHGDHAGENLQCL